MKVALLVIPLAAGWAHPVKVALLVILLAAGWALTPHLPAARAWLESLGPAAPAAFVVIYALAAVAAVPGSALTVAAGALFGSAVGVAVVSVGATLGAALAFLVARHLARDAVAARLGDNPLFQRLDALTVRHGATVVAIARLVPVFPYNLLNYGFGLTRVPFATYLLWTWLCMLPGIVCYVVGADVVATAFTSGRVPWALAALATAIAAGLALATRRLRARLTS